jgi:hypothetical protein
MRPFTSRLQPKRCGDQGRRDSSDQCGSSLDPVYGSLPVGAIPYAGGRRPMSKKTTDRISPITNNTQAMFTAVPAIPVKPNNPAIMAIIKNVAAHPIMAISFPLFLTRFNP